MKIPIIQIVALAVVVWFVFKFGLSRGENRTEPIMVADTTQVDKNISKRDTIRVVETIHVKQFEEVPVEKEFFFAPKFPKMTVAVSEVLLRKIQSQKKEDLTYSQITILTKTAGFSEHMPRFPLNGDTG